MNDVHNLQARRIQPPKSFSTSSCKPMRKDKKKSKKLCNFKKTIYLCTRLTAIRFDSLAQQVEHNTFNVGVLGSSPKRITERRDLKSPFLFLNILSPLTIKRLEIKTMVFT